MTIPMTKIENEWNTNSEIMGDALEEKADLHNVKTFAGGKSFKPNPPWNV